jgi:uncharacterized membrane protein
MRALTLATALGSGLVAGVFLAFSSFVMDGLDRLPASQSVAAMNHINRTAVRPVFMIVFVGTALGGLVLAIWAWRTWGNRAAPFALAGGLLYLVGSFGVTSVANVPLNDKLDKVAPESARAAHEWSHYMATWMPWNHVRGIASLAAAALLTVAFTHQ